MFYIHLPKLKLLISRVKNQIPSGTLFFGILFYCVQATQVYFCNVFVGLGKQGVEDCALFAVYCRLNWQSDTMCSHDVFHFIKVPGSISGSG